MGKERKAKTLKGKVRKNKNNFSTAPNIQVIDESIPDITKPSQKSNVLENKRTCENLVESTIKPGERTDEVVSKKVKVDSTVKVGERTDEVVSKKVKKRKIPKTNEPTKNVLKPEPIHKTQTKMEKTANEDLFDEDEANVKDEDIDKFCDDIDDADNEQYEEWIKLVEEKLREKKK